MRKTTLLVIVAIFVLGCAEDIIVKPPTDLRGVYHGIYERIKNYSSGSGGRIRHDQYIEWSFSDQQFWCDAIDTTLKPRFTCDFTGFYDLADKMILKDTIVDAMTCDHNDIPVGNFQFMRKENPDGLDSLIMEQLDTKDDVYKAIRIKRWEG
jgi:hypothetical protein